MAFSSYKELLTAELSLPSFAEYDNALNFHWESFSYVGEDRLQYLLTKRAMFRYLLSKHRAGVDVEIGFDVIKGSQYVLNLEKMIRDVTNEIAQSFPEFSDSPNLISPSTIPELMQGD